MEQSLFSVIITAYNMETYITECIDSVLRQNYKEIEVIIVDDGSTDGTLKRCEAYLEEERVRLIHQENQGVIIARKTGIKHATGRYLIFIDGDDWVDEDLCSRYAEYLAEKPADIIISGMLKEYANRFNVVKNKLQSGYYDEDRIVNEIYPKMIYTGNFYEKGLEFYICGKAVKREILLAVMDSINDNIRFGEGGTWLFSTMLKVHSAMITEDTLYHYRMRSDSMAMQDEKIDKIIDVYENLLKNVVTEKKCVEQFLLQLDYMVMYLLIWKNLSILNSDENILYPFPNLKKGSRIVIYGAWRFGQALKGYIEKRNFGEIVLWIDKNAEEYRQNGWKVEVPEKITEVEYDYIILATEVYSVANSMRKTLEQLGITQNILAIDNEVVNQDYIPDIVRKVKEKYKD